MKDNDLEQELEKTGTAEISKGIVNRVTQAVDESGGKAKFLVFGEMREKTITPIDEACAKCDHCHFDTVKQCQEIQAKDARARGFTEVICPQQFR